MLQTIKKLAGAVSVFASIVLDNLKKNRNCVYETLCPKPLACPPSCSPGNLFTILLQLTKSEATSFNSFRDIFVGSFRCPNLQRALIQKNAKAITK